MCMGVDYSYHILLHNKDEREINRTKKNQNTKEIKGNEKRDNFAQNLQI